MQFLGFIIYAWVFFLLVFLLQLLGQALRSGAASVLDGLLAVPGYLSALLGLCLL